MFLTSVWQIHKPQSDFTVVSLFTTNRVNVCRKWSCYAARMLSLFYQVTNMVTVDRKGMCLSTRVLFAHMQHKNITFQPFYYENTATDYLNSHTLFFCSIKGIIFLESKERQTRFELATLSLGS